ncbi:MAG: peptidylprolyl isomerase [Epsilonproteobacteria bacterium]|nr:MAG: peptidylprolyl isomerase [Campylobacterota bacterium]
MKQFYALFLGVLYIFITGCSVPAPEAVKVKASQKKIDYLSEVKPILDRRCVSCHSCYNSPCQAKFSSFEGVDRGASKDAVYNATRLRAMDPTRLFVDAKNTQEWRDKNFFSLTESHDANESYNDSIMIHMLSDKMEHPEVIGEYDPEHDELLCPRNSAEMGQYLTDKPNHGMPYGFPALKELEYKTLAQWLQQGANGSTQVQQKKITTPSLEAAQEIKKWERFLNAPDAKHAMTARYLYEHYFLAHINFKAAPTEFYELVRSTAPSPKAIEIIPTLRPYDDPGTEIFYYRFERIHSTIVHKTHMVVEFDDTELARINELFIEPKWEEIPHRVGYETKMSANPFVTYFQIPVRARYQFLLDHNKYIVMTFIRGPVCRGQMALNVIHDHFWVMFQDPEFDLSVEQPDFLMQQSENLSMPIESSSKSLWRTFSDTYRNKYETYYLAKQELYDQVYPNGLGLEGIWRGNSAEDSPLLTIYRHFDSASVHHGVIGELPRTMWVIDYPQFERIYYALVAGYDVYGNVSHQTNIRRYMDFLRIEGEGNFLAYLPKETRLEMFKSWYIGDSKIQSRKDQLNERGTLVVYTTPYPKSEFIEKVVNEHILKSTGIAFDDINYYKHGEKPPLMPKRFNSYDDIIDGARSLTAPGTGFIKHAIDHGLNYSHLRIIMPDGESYITTLVVNRWHDNVNSLFSEDDTLDSSKDTIDFIHGSIGSYINVFGVVHYTDLPDFFDLIANFNGSDLYMKKVKKYFVSRADDEFWETYDWFQNHFNEADPLQAGLYDLNRYYRKSW